MQNRRFFETKLWAVIVTVAALYAITSLLLHHVVEPGNEIEVVVTDTVTVVKRDTVFIEAPKPISMEKIRFIQVPIKDTVVLHDTVFVRLELDQKVYSDSLYKAWVSGYEANLDSIQIYQKETTTIIDKTITKKYRFGAGIQVGYGVGSNFFSPYIGIGIQYNLLNW